MSNISIWLDDLSRDRLNSGSLVNLINDKKVVGVTTNPSIFQKAIQGKGAYDEQIAQLTKDGATVDETIIALTTDDVRRATDIFRPIYDASDAVNGRVSIEVDPRFAHNCDATVKQAEELWKILDRPNGMIKIPATLESLPAITQTLAKGISVNVTLIFSKERYLKVIDAYIEGIRLAKENGHDISKIASVASFFVSRVDTAIDKQLEEIGTDEAKSLLGKAALANARVAYAAYQKAFASSEVWSKLEAAGAKKQRPLWASTGVKNPNYSKTLYVDELVADDVVNTMPEATLDAVFVNGEKTVDTLDSRGEESQAILDKIESLGISISDTLDKLEADGVESFIAAWSELINDVEANLNSKR